MSSLFSFIEIVQQVVMKSKGIEQKGIPWVFLEANDIDWIFIELKMSLMMNKKVTLQLIQWVATCKFYVIDTLNYYCLSWTWHIYLCSNRVCALETSKQWEDSLRQTTCFEHLLRRLGECEHVNNHGKAIKVSS